MRGEEYHSTGARVLVFKEGGRAMRLAKKWKGMLGAALSAIFLLVTVFYPVCGPPFASSKTEAYAAESGSVAAVVESLPKVTIDFSLSSSELSCTSSSGGSYVKPGNIIVIKAKVRKNTASAYGGGKVSFFLNGQMVDRVPFWMGKAENIKTVTCSYVLPLDNYQSLSKNQKVNLNIEARVEADALSKDPNLTNNTAKTTVQVVGLDELPKFTQSADAKLVGIEANSSVAQNTARPGAKLDLKARIVGSGVSKVSFYIDGKLLKESITTVTRGSSGTVASASFYVPWECEGPLKYQVKLGNGDQVSLDIPVEKFDYQIQASDVTWANKIVPGQNLLIEANVHNKSRIPFSSVYDILRVLFIVNGNPSEPIKVPDPGGALPYISKTVYYYRVPQGFVGPLKVTVVVDAGGLIRESREDNNVVQINSSGPTSETSFNLSVTSADLHWSPQQFAPGQNVQLAASVRNTSNKAPGGSVEITFKINGTAVPGGDKKQFYGPSFAAGQTKIVSVMWKVPQDLTGDPVFSVVIDPDCKLKGDNPADNEASVVIPLGKSDLAVSELACLTSDLAAGKPAELAATINNFGRAKVTGVDVVFKINGSEVARKQVDIPPNSLTRTTASFTVPNLTSTSEPASITGQSGYQKTGPGIVFLDYTVEVDTEQKISESNEANNTAGPVSLKAAVPSKTGTVFVQVMDLQGNPLSGARATITAGTQQASATTDAQGYCTFKGVPFGAYEVSVTCAGYNPGKSYDGYLYSGNKFAYSEIYLDKYATISGTVKSRSGSPLARVDVRIEGTTSYRTVTNDSGSFSMKIPPGRYTLRYLKQGYQRLMQDTVLNPVGDSTFNVLMDPTNNAYVSGNIFGVNGEPLSGMKVEFLDGNNLLASTTTGSTGSYSLSVPIPKEEMWVKVKISGRGLSKNEALYLKRGLEHDGDYSFEPLSSALNAESSSEGRMVPWAVCASMPGTPFNNSYKVETIYGMFSFRINAKIENSRMTQAGLTVTPDYWLYSSVSSSWNPGELFAVGTIAKCVNTILSITPIGIPLAVNMHSTSKTKVTVKKIAVISDGKEVWSVYPNTTGSGSWAPGVEVNWNNCRIKYYLKVDPDSDTANPLAGYNCEKLMMEWDPKNRKFTRVGHYAVVGWEEGYAREIMVDVE